MNAKHKHEGPMEELFELEENFVENLPISNKKKSRLLVVLDLLVNIAIIIVFVTVIRKFLISPFQVYGPSMCNTLNYYNSVCQKGFGEYLIVNKAVYQNFFGFRISTPKRGDIIVFHPPSSKRDFFIKRIIGLPGEKIKLEKNGKIIIFNEKYKNGLEPPEEYLKEKNSTFTFSNQQTAVYEIPENKYFVMGDNRKESTDSRTCFGPNISICEKTKKYFLDLEEIEGKAWIVLWPFKGIRTLKNPVYE